MIANSVVSLKTSSILLQPGWDEIDTRLRQLIDDYLAAVKTAVSALRALDIKIPASNTEWALYQLPSNLNLPEGTRLQKHGYGCRFKSSDVYVDFDFGAEGQICGFDCWRLYDFCRGRLSTHYGFTSEAELQQAFDDACQSNELTFSGYILWYDRIAE